MKSFVDRIMQEDALCCGLKLPADVFDIDLSLFDCPDLFPKLCEEKRQPCKETVSEISAENKDNDIPAGEKRKRRRKKSLTGLSRKRREANARERRRIQELNQGFVYLKQALPLPNVDISKFEILRLALTWIDHLETMLKNYDEEKELLDVRQMETSRPEDLMNVGATPATHHACQYHEFPDLKNTLWDDSIGLQETSSGENEGCVHIRSVSNFNFLFV